MKLVIMNDVLDYKPLRAYLNKLAPLTDQEWNCLPELLYIKQVGKKELFHTAGRQCKTVGFILEGCFRSVKTYEGEERTFDFAMEGEFITDYYGILTQTNSEMDTIAIEQSVVACVDAAALLKLFDSTMTWQKIGRRLAEYAVCYYRERLVASYYESPKIRYQRLMKTSPELFLRIPHHILANYLGVTKETLSRLRNPVR